MSRRDETCCTTTLPVRPNKISRDSLTLPSFSTVKLASKGFSISRRELIVSPAINCFFSFLVLFPPRGIGEVSLAVEIVVLWDKAIAGRPLPCLWKPMNLCLQPSTRSASKASSSCTLHPSFVGPSKQLTSLVAASKSSQVRTCFLHMCYHTHSPDGQKLPPLLSAP